MNNFDTSNSKASQLIIALKAGLRVPNLHSGRSSKSFPSCRKSKQEIAFRLRDIGYDPVMWPILLVLALAFKDNAFELTPYNLVELKVYIVSIY